MVVDNWPHTIRKARDLVLTPAVHQDERGIRCRKREHAFLVSEIGFRVVDTGVNSVPIVTGR
jgi:hypothetical protein